MVKTPKSVTEPGFNVNVAGTTLFFPLVTSDKFRQGDIRLIVAATGTDWDAWLKLLKKNGLDNAVTRQGFFAVAVQRVRDMDVDSVVAFIDDLPLIGGIELVFPPELEKSEGKQSLPPSEEETAT
jgi:hypothetical protein